MQFSCNEPDPEQVARRDHGGNWFATHVHMSARCCCCTAVQFRARITGCGRARRTPKTRNAPVETLSNDWKLPGDTGIKYLYICETAYVIETDCERNKSFTNKLDTILMFVSRDWLPGFFECIFLCGNWRPNEYNYQILLFLLWVTRQTFFKGDVRFPRPLRPKMYRSTPLFRCIVSNYFAMTSCGASRRSLCILSIDHRWRKQFNRQPYSGYGTGNFRSWVRSLEN